jgi:hypothetical protein
LKYINIFEKFQTTLLINDIEFSFPNKRRACCGRDHMVIGFTTICAISAYYHKSWEFEPRSWRGVLDTTLCDKVCQ